MIPEQIWLDLQYIQSKAASRDMVFFKVFPQLAQQMI
jgi:hypothetical protein